MSLKGMSCFGIHGFGASVLPCGTCRFSLASLGLCWCCGWALTQDSSSHAQGSSGTASLIWSHSAAARGKMVKSTGKSNLFYRVFFHKPSRIFCGSVFLSRPRPEAVLLLLHWEENACKCPLCSGPAPGHCTVFNLGLCRPINRVLCMALRKKIVQNSSNLHDFVVSCGFFPHVSCGPGITPTGVPLWEWPTLKMYCSREELIRGKWFIVSLFQSEG